MHSDNQHWEDSNKLEQLLFLTRKLAKTTDRHQSSYKLLQQCLSTSKSRLKSYDWKITWQGIKERKVRRLSRLGLADLARLLSRVRRNDYGLRISVSP